MGKGLKLELLILESTIRIRVLVAALDLIVLLPAVSILWVMPTLVSPCLTALVRLRSPPASGRNTPVPDNDPKELVEALRGSSPK